MGFVHASRGPLQQQRCFNSSTLQHSTCHQPSRLLTITYPQELLRRPRQSCVASRLVIAHSQTSSGSNADEAASTSSNSSSSSQPSTAQPAAAPKPAAGGAAQASPASSSRAPIDWQARRKQRVVDDLVDVSGPTQWPLDGSQSGIKGLECRPIPYEYFCM
jgi:hypothetical protein